MHRGDHFSMSCSLTAFLFITCGLNFSMHASHKATALMPKCTEYCLAPHWAFWNHQISWVYNFAVLLCIKICCSSTKQNAPPCSKQLTWFFYLLCLLRFTNPEAWFLFLTTSRWFAVRLDAICAIFVTVVAFGSLILAKSKYRCEKLFVVWLQFMAAFTIIKLNSCTLSKSYTGSSELY